MDSPERTNQTEIASIRQNIDSVKVLLTEMGAQVSAIQEQVDRLSAKVGLVVDTPVSTFSTEDAVRQQRILKSGRGWAAYLFARDVAGANIPALQQVIHERGDGRDAYCFAKNITGADIDALQHVVLDRGKGNDAYYFAHDITGADIDALQRVVMERGNSRDVYQFAKNITGTDLVALHNRLIYLYTTGDDINSESGKERYLDKFNNDVDIQSRLKAQMDAAPLSAESAARQQKILDSRDGWDAYQFARDVKGADIQALQGVVLKHGDAMDANFFAQDIPGADIPALQRVVLERGDDDDVYYFAKDVGGADLQLARNRLVELCSDYMDSFNNDQGIQARLQTQMDAASQPECNAISKKRRPS